MHKNNDFKRNGNLNLTKECIKKSHPQMRFVFYIDNSDYY